MNKDCVKNALMWITTILQKHQIPFQISGGLAASIYGANRPLADIDIDISDNGFESIIEDVKTYIIYGPARYKSDKWDLMLMTLNYKGQEIDLSGAESTYIFSEQAKEWFKLTESLAAAPIKNVFDIDLPVIPLFNLISYKKILAREVDLIDIAQIEKNNLDKRDDIFLIRQANVMDAEGIAKVHIDSWRATYRGRMPDSVLNNLSLNKRTEEWRERLKNGVYVWVITKEEKIIGFASLCPSRDSDADSKIVAEISTIYLLPEFWRKGLGRKLSNVIFDEAINKGFKQISLWVLESNDRAINFYKSLGFEATGDKTTDHIGCENLVSTRYRKVL